MQDNPLPPIRLFVLGPEWGLPSISPFGIKLATWMRMAGVPHELCVEDDPRRGPKKKSPWIEMAGERLGDTEIIVRALGERHGVLPDAWLAPEQGAAGLFIRRSFETHFQAITEHGLFCTDEGWRALQPHFRFLPALVRPIALPFIRSDARKEAWIRGIGRHSPDEQAAIARQDLDALATLLGGRAYLFGDRPTLTDCSVYGFLRFLQRAPFPTPAKAHLEASPRLLGFVERMTAAYWADGVGLVAPVPASGSMESPSAPGAAG